ncbi:MAG: xanthine dehydrogenase family protein molybdopterin-binding subunit, partial [Oscillospiraceae bacterium]|nr:xanthine dehydrogenase family protein molybdopterin-binding subunit [Oscillospiraceae bacterium]
EDAKFHLLNYAAELLGCDRDGLDVVDNMVVSSKDPNATMPFPELARAAHNDGKRFIGFAWYDNTTKDVNHETNQGDAYATYIYATQVADVEIDTETGEIEVLRVGAAHDVGSAINPMMIEQQIEGAILQGMGYGMMEEIILDKGYMKTPNFSKFLIPTAKDMPEMKTYIVESDTDRGPYGAKGVGEGAIIPTAIAVVNAVYDAVGVRIKELPVTPEKILAGLEELKNKA